MTKKDYTLIGDALKYNLKHCKRGSRQVLIMLIYDIASVLKERNIRFDTNKFLKHILGEVYESK